MSVPLREARSPLVAFGNGYGDHLINLPALRALAWGFGGRMRLLCHPGARRNFFADLPVRSTHEYLFRSHTTAIDELELPEWDALIWLNPWTSPMLDEMLERTPPGRSVGLFSRFAHAVPRDFSKNSGDLAFDVAQVVFPEARFEHYDQPPLLPRRACKWAHDIRRRLPAGRRLLVVHADTGEEKRWPVERFRAVLDAVLTRRPEILVMVVGMEDLGLEHGSHADRILLALGLPMAHAVALVSQADLFLGIDSCFLHAADSFRVPGVGLFGVTNPREFGFRLGGISRHVEANGMEAISVPSVLEALAEVEQEAAARCPVPRAPEARNHPEIVRDLRRQHIYTRLEHGRRFTWRISRLWREAEGLPVLDLALDAFDFDQTVWFEPGESPTVRKVAHHLQRVLETNAEYPVILSPNGEVMDGWHRLAKAWMEGRETVPGVRLLRDPVPDLVEDLDSGGSL
jgi:hypothetical protein